jgi:hypothetical protein
MGDPNTISFSLTQASTENLYVPGNSDYGLIARVTFVLLDDSNKEKFDTLGGWKSIGTIECVPFINFNDPNTEPIIARPLSSNITKYPLLNELVLLKILVSKEAQNSFGNYKPEVYYTDVISIFNAPEENATPDQSFLKINPNAKSITGDYISSGTNKRLIKAPGDITIEGRRGGSFRLGSNTPGFNTPWKSSKSSPILILSNNPYDVSGSVAKFESVNSDGSILVMMSGHNINFQAASSNFDSYNTTINIPEKNNIVVADQEPKSKPQESLKQDDNKPIPKETPQPTNTPVSNPAPVSQQPQKKTDDEKLPEREDLMEIGIEYDDVKSSVGTANSQIIDTKALTDAAVKESEKEKDNPGVVKTSYTKKQVSRAATQSDRIVKYLKEMQGTGFLEKLTRICNKYSIDPGNMLVVMAYESGGAFPKGALKDSTSGRVLAAGLIQFTDAKKNSVFQNIRKQPQFSSLQKLSDVLDVPAVKTSTTTSKYNFDQLDLLDFYLSTNSSALKNPVNGKVDRYATYGVVFFPEIVSNGTIKKDPFYVLGSSSKNKSFPYSVGKWNPSINDGYPITVQAFKLFVDSLFINRR